AAYLLTRYASEYKMDEIPAFVTKVIMPVVYRLGKLLNKYEHFKNAPEPIYEVPEPVKEDANQLSGVENN
ncbi:unnamed protein product, partial [marine sediment metagenome]